MVLRYPTYYENFRCIAASCPDSCCAEWDVLVDPQTARRYLAMEGPLGDAIREKLLVDDAGAFYFAITDRRCPMWRTDKLCRIQAELDHDALCKTCREFPRLTHDFGNFCEKGLALSCPEAANMILTGSHSWVETEVPGGEAGDYDEADMECLLRTRTVMLAILSDPNYSVPQALALGLLYGYHAQEEFDGGEEFPFDAAAQLEFALQFAKKTDLSVLREFYLGLEILTEAWETRLRRPVNGIHWPEAIRALASSRVSPD